MARRKNAPDLVKVKCGVAERLREIRTELFGERGGPELARRLGIPVRTWYNYEAGVTVPAEIILHLLELTAVEASWLLHGSEPKHRDNAPPARNGTTRTSIMASPTSVESLLRFALQRLDRGEIPLRESIASGRDVSVGSIDRIGNGEDANLILVRVDDPVQEPLTSDTGPRFVAARREWQAAELDHRCLFIADDTMLPLISPGAYAAYSDQDDSIEDLDGNLVVAWVAGEPPTVRRFQSAGRYALLLAENPKANPSTRLVDLVEGGATSRFRLVSWISTPR